MAPESQIDSPPPQNFIRRTLIAGSIVWVLSLLSGIVLLFWWEYGSAFFQNPDGRASQLILQGTFGPIFFGILLFPLSAIVVFAFAVILYAGFRRRNLYLSVLSFIILGVYWLWLVKIISEGAFD